MRKEWRTAATLQMQTPQVRGACQALVLDVPPDISPHNQNLRCTAPVYAPMGGVDQVDYTKRGGRYTSDFIWNTKWKDQARPAACTPLYE
jgi:hypothetical protein